MALHITDFPLEVAECVLIVGLALGLFIMYLALRRMRKRDEESLSKANDELKHLRHMLDRILMVEKGYARPKEELSHEREAHDHPRSNRLF